MYRLFCLFAFLIFTNLNSFAQAYSDTVAFVVESNVVTESDIRAYAFILGKAYPSQRDEVVKQAVEIEKNYYCLIKNYPFANEFEKEFVSLFYEYNLLKGNRFIGKEYFKSYGIDFGVLRDNLFKLLFVNSFAELLEDKGEERDGCQKIHIYFTK